MVLCILQMAVVAKEHAVVDQQEYENQIKVGPGVSSLYHALVHGSTVLFPAVPHAYHLKERIEDECFQCYAADDLDFPVDVLVTPHVVLQPNLLPFPVPANQ